MRNRMRGLFIVSATILAARPGLCTDLADLLQNVSDVTLDSSNTFHQPHFSYALNPENVQVIDGLNSYIAGQFATFPLGSSAGGFTFMFDPATGTGTRTSKTFGPQFAERALTIGKGKYNVGVQFLHATYDSLNGTDLKDGSLTLQLRHEDEEKDGRTNTFDYYEGDVISNQLGIDLTLDTMIVVGTWGVTDKFDVGAAIPFVHADMSVTANQTIQRLGTSDEVAAPFTHEFDPTGRTTNVNTVSQNATGLGDIVLRGKYNFLDPKKKSAFALAVDLRLPTGNENNLMGTDDTQVKVYGIGSWTISRFAPHLNVGYTHSIGTSRFGNIPDEANYTAGFEIEAHTRVTVLADVIGRTLLDATNINQGSEDFFYNPGGTIPDPPPAQTYPSVSLPQLQASTGNLNLLQGSLGLKINPGGNWLISLGALVPLNDNGLKSGTVALFGLDYNF